MCIYAEYHIKVQFSRSSHTLIMVSHMHSHGNGQECVDHMGSHYVNKVHRSHLHNRLVSVYPLCSATASYTSEHHTEEAQCSNRMPTKTFEVQ